MTTEKRNDEIDLIEVFQKMGQGIANLFNKLINFLYQVILFFIRRAVLITIVLIMGISFGFMRYKTTPRYYSSSLEAYSNAMSSIDMINYINNIHELFVENNKENLTSKLNIDTTGLDKIKDVKAFKAIDLNKDGITDIIDYNDKYQTSDSTISRSRFIIKVEVYDQSVFPLIQNRILQYIEQNKYISELNSIRKKQLEELIVKLNSEINILDSLKKTEYFNKNDDKLKTQAGQLLVMNEQPTQLYHSQIIGLYKEKQNLEQQLELRTDPITIIQDFSALSITENNLFFYLKRWLINAFVLGVLLALIIENFRKLKNVVFDARKK